jgi:hypothetical protein
MLKKITLYKLNQLKENSKRKASLVLNKIESLYNPN